MKNILRKIKAVILNRRFKIVVVVLAIVGGALWWYTNDSLSKFIAAYDSYEVLAGVQQNAAYVPGATNNPVRDQLNADLGQVLGDKTPAKERLARAAEGLELLKQLNTQVDAINTTGEPVAGAIAAFEAEARNPGNILHRSVMADLVSNAKVQMATIQTIRGLSYKANFETIQIFNRIIAEKGQLTDKYKIELNNDIPAVEEEFNNRQNAYADLEKNINVMQNAFDSLGTH